MDEEKIEEYLKKQGISSMQETGPKKVVSVCFSPHSISIFQSLVLFFPKNGSQTKAAEWYPV